MNNELIDERAASPVGQLFKVCASKTEAEALKLTKTNPNILYFSSDTNTIIFNGSMRTNPTPDLNSVLKKTDIIDNTYTNDNTKALAASQGKILNDKKIDKSEIVDDTSTDDATKPLSARQGKSLQYEITVLENNIQDLQTSIPTKTSQLTNDSNYVATNNVLTKNNTTVYNPTNTYHPATKKYVDDKLNDSSISIVEFDYNLVNALTKTSTTEEVNAAFANRSQLKTNSIVKLIDINDSSDAFDGSNGYRLCHKVNVDSPDSFIIEYFSDNNNNEVVEIVFTTGNVEVNRMSIAPTIPNDILKFKYINVADDSLLTINKQLSGIDAYNHIIKIFGSDTTIADIVTDICENHTKYYIHSHNTNYNNIEVANSYAYYNQGDGYELQFNISHLTNNGPVTKRFGIKINTADKQEDLLYIEDILVSDNLQRVVKRTKSEYDSIGTKDASTMYGITE